MESQKLRSSLKPERSPDNTYGTVREEAGGRGLSSRGENPILKSLVITHIFNQSVLSTQHHSTYPARRAQPRHNACHPGRPSDLRPIKPPLRAKACQNSDMVNSLENNPNLATSTFNITLRDAPAVLERLDSCDSGCVTATTSRLQSPKIPINSRVLRLSLIAVARLHNHS